MLLSLRLTVTVFAGLGGLVSACGVWECVGGKTIVQQYCVDNKISVTASEMAAQPVDIDGGVLEGGGQILRLAASFSYLTKVPIKVRNIRAGRSKPGLMAQHLKGLELVQKLSGGQLVGAEMGSTEVTFFPGERRGGGEFSADTQTAGSVGLLIQVALPCALFSSTTTILQLRGGTNAEMAPQFDYTTEVFRPLLERFGATFDYKLLRRGYFPRGGGEVHIRVNPVRQLKPIKMIDGGKILRIWGWAFVAGTLPIKLASVMADSATVALQRAFKGVEINIEAYKEREEDAVGNGSGINIVAETTTGCILGASGLGKRDVRPEQVGKQAADDLISTVETGACVDPHAQDQMVVLMALADGISQVKVGPVTQHTETAIYIAKSLSEAKFNIIKQGPNSNIIECTGIGLLNPV
ncbi:RNA 3'-terminal phosphate cyclase [Schistocerca cancellata]|uniref:RNA 3'-terminal phosphate cyclase n=1 Tax=Schistocerca cancellata TaxID=274614 RepID=UPI002118DCB1|nr:RNA 3'-terminal phosphate cyclase [Schistocerca cancellata]